MSLDLNSAEHLVDVISERIVQLLRERDILKSELIRASGGVMERDKAFVKLYRDKVFDDYINSEKVVKLEHLLSLRLSVS